MARQSRVVHECPECGGPLKRTIGAKTRKKFWECVYGGSTCYRRMIREQA